MKINFVSSLGTDEFREMYTKSGNIEIMNGTETSDAINELFKSFLKRYLEGLETKMKGNSFISERVDSLYYHLHKIRLNRAGSYIDSPEYLKVKGAAINLKNKNNDCFKHVITVALNHSNDWKKFEQNNKTVALNILYVPYNTKQIRPE